MEFKYDYPLLSFHNRLDIDLTNEQIDEIIRFLLEDTDDYGEAAIIDEFAKLESLKGESIRDSNIRVAAIYLKEKRRPFLIENREPNSVLIEIRIKYISLSKKEQKQLEYTYSEFDNGLLPHDKYTIGLIH